MLPKIDPKAAFDGVSETVTITHNKCSHDHLKQPTANSVQCIQCNAGWDFSGAIPQPFLDRLL